MSRSQFSVVQGILETESGKTIEIGTPDWEAWLLQAQSFRYEPKSSDSSFTARKEKSFRGEADYWYGYRKVEGKLFKRYIGKASDVTLERLEKIAALLNIPPEPRQKPEVTEPISVTQNEEIGRLQAEIEQLQNELQKALGKQKA